MKDRRSGDRAQPLYMISVAAVLSGMHPQTLRIYERKELICPQRSPGNTRLYSEADIERLRLIQQMTSEGINLAGVTRILQLTAEVERLTEETEALKARIAGKEREFAEANERPRREYRTAMVMVRSGGLAKRRGTGTWSG